MSWPVLLTDIPASFSGPAQDNTAIYIALVGIAVPMIAKVALDFVKWIGQRTVNREDEDKKALQSRVEKLESAMENRFKEQAQEYRAQLKEQTAEIFTRMEKLEQDLRHDMTRAMADFRQGRRK